MNALELVPHTLVRVTWIDSAFAKGWHEAFKPPPVSIVSVGFVTHNNPTLLTLCATVATDGSELNPLSIPWGTVSQLEKLTK